MDLRYFAYCHPGNPFYDAPSAHRTAGKGFAAIAPLPAGWRQHTNEDWVTLLPPEPQLPDQGWKIHASATPENAVKVLEAVYHYCVPGQVTFKFLRDHEVLKRRNSKYGDRSASGKFITLYPRDEEHLALILDELGDILHGEDGPYILSDLRWRSGPLYVRYGGFILRQARGPSGEVVHCIQDPDGHLVPDARGPAFRPPPWVTLPACLSDALATRHSGALTDFPFQASRALHFSNGGGVYEAIDTRTGTTVLLKEARPLAGLDSDGTDAVTRLRQEHWALQRLTGLPCIPHPIDFRRGHEHYFLARQYIDGKPLAREVLRRNPFLNPAPGHDGYTRYTAWALHVLDQVAAGVDALHERGVVFGDLHPGNILIRPDDTIAFIDFETSSAVSDDRPQAIAAPGYHAPDGYTGPAVDRYALGCLRLGIFIPLTLLLPWGEGKVDDLLTLAGEHFPLPADFAQHVRHDLGLMPRARHLPAPAPALSLVWPVREKQDWLTLHSALTDGILATATPHRTDRLFPGDIEQFQIPEGGMNFAHGAAGVLWALAVTGTPILSEHLDWLTAALNQEKAMRPGFYDGLCGIAYALYRLGRPDQAGDLLDQAITHPRQDLDASLYNGLSGIGLTLLHFAQQTNDTQLLDEALRLAIPITEQLQQPAPKQQRPGLLHGASGSALFLLRLYEATGDPAHLQSCEAALHQDLGALGLNDGQPAGNGEARWRAPFLATGSAGVGMVLHDVLTHHHTDVLAHARDAFRDTALSQFHMHAGLFTGRAGALIALRHMHDDTPASRNALQHHLENYSWHAVCHEGHLAFLGEQGLRLSTDLATGTAGILLATGALYGRSGTHPFFAEPQ